MHLEGRPVRARRRAVRGLLAVRRGRVRRVPDVHCGICPCSGRIALAGRRAGRCAVRCVRPYSLELGQRPGQLGVLQQQLLQRLRALRRGEQARLGLRAVQPGWEQRRVELQDVLERALQHIRVALPQVFRALRAELRRGGVRAAHTAIQQSMAKGRADLQRWRAL